MESSASKEESDNVANKRSYVAFVEILQEFEAQVAAGRAKAIGVSNFNKRQLQGILDICTIKPANLQVSLVVLHHSI